MGAMPDASLMLEEGQCARPIPLLANCLASFLSSMQQWANQQSSLSQPIRLPADKGIFNALWRKVSCGDADAKQLCCPAVVGTDKSKEFRNH